MKKIILIISIFIALSLISIRGLITEPGTIGHNWDWLIPPRNDYLKELFFNSFYTWDNSNLGESRILQLPSLPFMIFLFTPSFFGFDGDFISKFLIIITMVLSGTGMFFLLENILKEEWKEKNFLFPSFIGGFFYAFSPFLFADLIGGAATQFFAYALIPWLLFFFKKTNQEKRYFWPYFSLSVLILSFITISLQALVLSSLILGIYILIQKNKLLYLKNIISLYLVYIFINFYWFFPTVTEFFSLKNAIFSSNFYDLGSIKNNVPSLWEIFVSTGYWRPLFLYSIQPQFINPWLFFTYLTVAFILGRNLIFNKTKESLFWILILLLSFIVATGAREPMGDQVAWLYIHLPLMALFRSPQHLLVIPTLAFALLFGLAVRDIKYLRYKIILLFMLVIWIHPMFIYGDVASRYLREKQKDHLDLFRVPPGYNHVFDFLKERSKTEDFRILFLPISSSPRYLNTPYQNAGQGGDPLVIYSPYGTLVSDINYTVNNKKLAQVLETNIYERENAALVDKILNILNIKYIILRKDVIPEFSDIKSIWSFNKIENYLLVNSNIKKIYTSENVDFFENQNLKKPLLISSSQNPTYSNNNPNAILNAISLNISDNTLISDTSFSQIDPNIIKENDIFIQPEIIRKSNNDHSIEDQKLLHFTIPVLSTYEILIKAEDYSSDSDVDPLNPLQIDLDETFITRSPLKKENGFISYGNLELSPGDHDLKIILPEWKNLIDNGSFEDGIWPNDNPDILPTSEAREGKTALRLINMSKKPAFVSQTINNIKPGVSYKISFYAKTVIGQPPHIMVFQNSDIVREGKTIPKVNHTMGVSNSYEYGEVKFKTNMETRNATVYLYADPPESTKETIVLYDNLKIKRLFDTPLILRKKSATIKQSSPPEINVKKIDATKYKITVKNAQAPYFLNFLESFNTQWKVFILKNQFSFLPEIFETWLQNSMPESGHYIANYFGNSWLINEKGDYTLIIENRSQRLFYFGGIISLLVLIILIFQSSKVIIKRNSLNGKN